MSTLSAKTRKKTATVVVNGKPKFPIPDKAHAKLALAMVNQAKPPLTPAQKQKVVAKAHKVLGDKEVNPKTEPAKSGLPPQFKANVIKAIKRQRKGGV